MNGPKTEEREIDGLLVSTTQLPPFRALVLSKRLLPIVAPLLAAGADVAEIEAGSLAEGLDKLDDRAVQDLMLKMLAGTTVKVDGEIRTLHDENACNAVFVGRFMTMLRVAWFAVEVNFFPGGAGALLASSPLKVSR